MFSAKIFVLFAVVAVCIAAPNAHKLSSKRNLKITGGVNAEPGEYPYAVSVEWCFFGICEHICGGTIINESWVITGAGCLDDATRVIAGSVKLNVESDDKQSIDIAGKFAHPDFDVSGLGPNDIGLLKLKTPLQFGANVSAASLPTQGQNISGAANLTGFSDALLPDYNQLKVVQDLPVVSFSDCNAAIAAIIADPSPLDETSNICTLSSTANNCDGDIGSTLTQDGVVVGSGTWYIDPCSLAGAPNVFTNVANFVNWINDTISANS